MYKTLVDGRSVTAKHLIENAHPFHYFDNNLKLLAVSIHGIRALKVIPSHYIMLGIYSYKFGTYEEKSNDFLGA